MPSIETVRKWYDLTDPVHGFDHVLRVLILSEKIGTELDADLEILRAAALFHDATGAAPGGDGGRTTHEHDSAELAGQVLREEGWDQERINAVKHCIRAHRFRGNETPSSLEAKILFDADKLDVVGAFGVARTIGYAVQARQPIYAKPSQRFMDEGEKEQNEPHSAYHEYLFKLRRVRDRMHTAPAKARAEVRNRVLTSFFEQLALEASGEG